VFYRLLMSLALTISAIAAEPRDISIELEVIRLKYKLPACASAVVEDGRITAIGATGLRREDASVPVTPADIWHIGSCTKSMTATLIGVLVDEGKLRWDASVAEVLPDIPSHPAWRKVTIWDVVTQRSGIGTIARAMWPSGGTVRQQRGALARMLLAHSPTDPPGKFDYSNVGYGLLGAIIERVSGQSYEDLLRTKIFVPLGLKTAGFGAPATPGQLDQPWGHWRRNDRLTPVDPLPENQFPAVLAPAGCVHMSLADFARYAAWLSSGEPRLVKPETFARLQTPPADSSYAGGLWKSVLPGIGGEAVCHTGHMGGFFAVFYAGKNRACVSVFNTEGGGWEWLGDVITAEALKAAR
jgi:CubicO group peptidase (beta-lactamase class C family)